MASRSVALVGGGGLLLQRGDGGVGVGGAARDASLTVPAGVVEAEVADGGVALGGVPAVTGLGKASIRGGGTLNTGESLHVVGARHAVGVGRVHVEHLVGAVRVGRADRGIDCTDGHTGKGGVTGLQVCGVEGGTVGMGSEWYWEVSSTSTR